MSDLSPAKHVIQAEFFSDVHRITARVPVGTTGLLGLLNDTLTSVVDIEDAYISRLQQSARMLTSFELGGLNKQGVTLAMVTRREEMGPSGMLRSGYAKPTPCPMVIGTSAYEIRGIVEFPGKVDMQALVSGGTARFIVIFEATATPTAYPETPFSGGAIAINRALISYLAPTKGKA